MTAITLVFSVPPSVNKCWANVPGKGRVRTKAYRDWATLSGWDIVATLRRADIYARPVIAGHFKATLRVDTRGDIDNFCKMIFDLCQNVEVIRNDNDMDELHVYRSDVPGLTLVLESIDEAPKP